MFKNNTILAIIIAIVLAAIICFAIILCSVPKVTNINQTLQAVRLDDSGTPIGTAEITLQGFSRNYLIQEDRMYIEISSSDNYANVQINDPYGSRISSPNNVDLQTVFSATYTDTGENVAVGILFDKDYSIWAFQFANQNDVVWYVASTNESRSTEDIIQYFGGLVPGYQSS